MRRKDQVSTTRAFFSFLFMLILPVLVGFVAAQLALDPHGHSPVVILIAVVLVIAFHVIGRIIFEYEFPPMDA